MTSFSDLRRQVCAANRDLHRHGLVHAHSGNVSGIHRDSGVVLIKPSGVDIETLEPEMLVATDIGGRRLEARHVPDGIVSGLKPSVDLVHHRELYAADASLGGIVHTHSIYATAWAIVERPIPCAMTSMADEFGGDIPVGPFARIGGEEIGVGIVETLRGSRSRAVLMRSHGVFTVGAGAREAVKTAVMCEDVARTAMLARSLGELTRLDQADIDALYDRYQNVYGQRSPDAISEQEVQR